MTSPHQRLLLRIAIAFVWLYQGLWHKVFEVSSHHRGIMQQALGETWGVPAMKALGLFEALLGIAVLLSIRPAATALLQISLLIGMNAAGILFAGDQIADIGGMLTMNSVFITAIWINATLSRPR